MLTDILPELAASGARAWRDLAGLAEGENFRAAASTILLRESKLILDFIVGYRDLLAAALDESGLDPSALKKGCESMVECLDAFLELAPRLRSALVQFARPPHLAAQLEELTRQEAQATDARLSFRGWLDFLNRPLPPIDLERLGRGEADLAAGQFVQVETFEDLFSEPPGE